ncbi:hypothetical protein CLF_100740, partial [Clonorchis sinensis]
TCWNEVKHSTNRMKPNSNFNVLVRRIFRPTFDDAVQPIYANRQRSTVRFFHHYLESSAVCMSRNSRKFRSSDVRSDTASETDERKLMNSVRRMFSTARLGIQFAGDWLLGTNFRDKKVEIIIIDSMTSMFNADTSLPYNHDLFESLIVKKKNKDGWGGDLLLSYYNHSERTKGSDKESGVKISIEAKSHMTVLNDSGLRMGFSRVVARLCAPLLFSGVTVHNDADDITYTVGTIR